jgi:hypothetical protein
MRSLTFIHTMLFGVLVLYPCGLAAQDTTGSGGDVAVTAADTDGYQRHFRFRTIPMSRTSCRWKRRENK